jgi:hypothetical protein
LIHFVDRSARCGPHAPENTTLRKLNDQQPRLVALSDAELKVQRTNRSWIPLAARDAVLDPAHWSRRVRQEKYWRMVEIWNAQRTVH